MKFMNRNFLLGLLLVTANAFSQNSNVNDWRLAIQTWTFHKYSFLESIDKADSLGVRDIEVYPCLLYTSNISDIDIKRKQ